MSEPPILSDDDTLARMALDREDQKSVPGQNARRLGKGRPQLAEIDEDIRREQWSWEHLRETQKLRWRPTAARLAVSIDRLLHLLAWPGWLPRYRPTTLPTASMKTSSQPHACMSAMICLAQAWWAGVR